MIDFIVHYESLKSFLEEAMGGGRKVSLDSKLLRPPVERPSKIWAAAFNYKRGTADLKDGAGRGETLKFTPERWDDDSILFSMTDAPTFSALGLYREESAA